MSKYAGLNFYQKIVLMNKNTKVLLMFLLAFPYLVFYLLYISFDFVAFNLKRILSYFDYAIQRK